MGDHQRLYPHLPDGHYCVDDPDGRETLWSVESGRLRDYPPAQRWRPLPPAAPADLTGEQRHEWRADWYARVYWGFKDAIAEAIAADPLAAAHRFRDRLAADAIPVPVKPARRTRKRVTVPRRPRLSVAEQQRAAEALAARALAQAGMSVREIAETLDLPKTRVWRRHRQAETTVGEAQARATLVVRAVALQESLLAAQPFHPERAEQIAEWISDLRAAVHALTGRGVDRWRT